MAKTIQIWWKTLICTYEKLNKLKVTQKVSTETHKLSKIETKRDFIAARRMQLVTCKGASTRLTADFSSETTEGRRGWYIPSAERKKKKNTVNQELYWIDHKVHLGFSIKEKPKWTFWPTPYVCQSYSSKMKNFRYTYIKIEFIINRPLF